MNKIAKYNVFKLLSILITCVPVLIVTSRYTDFIVYSSGATMSFTAIIGVFIAGLFLKNKIIENFKVPSPFMVSAILFVIILLIEEILIPAKAICLTSMIACGIDEISFKRIYKRIELLLPDNAKAHRFLGFYTCRLSTLRKEQEKIK